MISNAIVSWQAPKGPKYQLEYKSDLNATNWTSFGSPLSGAGTNLSLTNLTGSQGFYRLLIMQ